MEKELMVQTVVRAQQGDSEAVNALFHAYYNDIYYFALKTVKNPDTAADITQDTFVTVVQHLGGLKEPAAFVAWARQIAYHHCTRYFKTSTDLLVGDDEEGHSLFEDIEEASAEFIPEEALDKDELKRIVLAIIDTLSPEQRAAVLLYYFDELSVAQIAGIQGVSEGTVKSRLNYARKAIKAAIEDYEKTHNIKLHALPFFPFLRFLLAGDKTAATPMAMGYQAAAQEAVSAAMAGAVASTTVAAATTAGMGKIVAIIAAAVVAVGALVGGGIALFGGEDKAEPVDVGESVKTEPTKEGTSTTTVPTQPTQPVEEEEALPPFADFNELRERVEDMWHNGGTPHPYPVRDPDSTYALTSEFDIFGRPDSLNQNSSLWVSDDGAGYPLLEVEYRVYGKTPEEIVELMKEDVATFNDFMGVVYNGDEIPPDYQWSTSDERYLEAATGGNGHEVVASLRQILPSPEGDVDMAYVHLDMRGVENLDAVGYTYLLSFRVNILGPDGGVWQAGENNAYF